MVTWNSGATPTTLTSEAAIKNAEADGLLAISRTNIVVNCPVIFTQNGGLLPKAKLSIGHQGEDEDK